MFTKIAVQIVNINGLSYTKKIIEDILVQTCPYHLTVIDQGSVETGTKEYLDFLEQVKKICVFRNKSNINLNILWNNLYWRSTNNLYSPYLCFLNNDVRIPSNFFRDTVDIFEKEKEVGAVIHATNHPKYCATSELNYIVLDQKIIQGYDFTMRQEVYTPIPEDIDTFGGDDFLFQKMYDLGWKTAIALSSPIIHYKAKSRRFFKRDRNEVIKKLEKYGIRRLPYQIKYSKQFPTFTKIVE